MNIKDPQDNSDYFWAAERWIILQILQPISQATQRFCGLTCFHIAYVIMVLSLISAIASGWVVMHLPLLDRPGAYLVHSFLAGLTVYRLLSTRTHCLHRIEHDAWKALAQGSMNPFLLVQRGSFCFIIAPVVFLLRHTVIGNVTIWTLVTFLSVPLYWLSMAYSACTPLPKDPSLLARALKKFLGALKIISGAGETVSNPA